MRNPLFVLVDTENRILQVSYPPIISISDQLMNISSSPAENTEATAFAVNDDTAYLRIVGIYFNIIDKANPAARFYADYLFASYMSLKWHIITHHRLVSGLFYDMPQNVSIYH